MKVIALLALILVCTQATDIQSVIKSAKDMLYNNKCFREVV